jgi:hypothetical protein
MDGHDYAEAAARFRAAAERGYAPVRAHSPACFTREPAWKRIYRRGFSGR